MIDWKRRCLELAEAVEHDTKLSWEMAEELIELGKREGEAQQKLLESWRCSDEKEKDRLYAEYLEMIR